MTATLISSIGRAVATQKEILFVPPRWRPNANVPIVLLCQGMSHDGWAWTDSGAISKPRMIAERYGLPCVGGDEWGAPALPLQAAGNDSSQAAAMTLLTWAQGQLGTKTGAGSALLFGTSRGSHLAWVLHKNNPGTFRASAHALVTVSPTDLYNDSMPANGGDGVYQGEIDAAYSDVGGWAAAKATHDPMLFASQMAGLPVGLFDTVDDPYAGGQAGVEALAAAIGGSTLEKYFYPPGGHDLSKINDDDPARFLMRHSGL